MLAHSTTAQRRAQAAVIVQWLSDTAPRRSPLETLEQAARAVAQDPSAFGRIVELTSTTLVRYAARFSGSVADAEDVVQEAYVKAYQALVAGRFDGRSSLTTWLYKIVTRTAIDHGRSRKRGRSLSDVQPEGVVDGVASAEAHVALSELSDFIGSLPPEQRSTLILQAMEGLSNREIAEVLECSEGAVEQRLVRARAALRAKEQAS